MSTEESNVAVLKEAYRRWHETKAGSVDHWLDLMTDDVQFRSLAEGAKPMAFTRTSTCKDDVKRYFDGLTRRMGNDLLSYGRIYRSRRPRCRPRQLFVQAQKNRQDSRNA